MESTEILFKKRKISSSSTADSGATNREITSNDVTFVQLDSYILDRIKQEPIDCDEEPNLSPVFFQQQINENSISEMPSKLATNEAHVVKLTKQGDTGSASQATANELLSKESRLERGQDNIKQTPNCPSDKPSEVAVTGVRRSLRQRFPARRLSTGREKTEPNNQQKQSITARMHPGSISVKNASCHGASNSTNPRSPCPSTDKHEKAVRKTHKSQTSSVQIISERMQAFREVDRQGSSNANAQDLPDLAPKRKDIEDTRTRLVIRDSNDVFRRRFRKALKDLVAKRMLKFQQTSMYNETVSALKKKVVNLERRNRELKEKADRMQGFITNLQNENEEEKMETVSRGTQVSMGMILSRAAVASSQVETRVPVSIDGQTMLYSSPDEPVIVSVCGQQVNSAPPGAGSSQTNKGYNFTPQEAVSVSDAMRSVQDNYPYPQILNVCSVTSSESRSVFHHAPQPFPSKETFVLPEHRFMDSRSGHRSACNGNETTTNVPMPKPGATLNLPANTSGTGRQQRLVSSYTPFLVNQKEAQSVHRIATVYPQQMFPAPETTLHTVSQQNSHVTQIQQNALLPANQREDKVEPARPDSSSKSQDIRGVESLAPRGQQSVADVKNDHPKGCDKRVKNIPSTNCPRSGYRIREFHELLPQSYPNVRRYHWEETSFYRATPCSRRETAQASRQQTSQIERPLRECVCCPPDTSQQNTRQGQANVFQPQVQQQERSDLPRVNAQRVGTNAHFSLQPQSLQQGLPATSSSNNSQLSRFLGPTAEGLARPSHLSSANTIPVAPLNAQNGPPIQLQEAPNGSSQTYSRSLPTHPEKHLYSNHPRFPFHRQEHAMSSGSPHTEAYWQVGGNEKQLYHGANMQRVPGGGDGNLRNYYLHSQRQQPQQQNVAQLNLQQQHLHQKEHEIQQLQQHHQQQGPQQQQLSIEQLQQQQQRLLIKQHLQWRQQQHQPQHRPQQPVEQRHCYYQKQPYRQQQQHQQIKRQEQQWQQRQQQQQPQSYQQQVPVDRYQLQHEEPNQQQQQQQQQPPSWLVHYQQRAEYLQPPASSYQVAQTRVCSQPQPTTKPQWQQGFHVFVRPAPSQETSIPRKSFCSTSSNGSAVVQVGSQASSTQTEHVHAGWDLSWQSARDITGIQKRHGINVGPNQSNLANPVQTSHQQVGVSGTDVTEFSANAPHTLPTVFCQAGNINSQLPCGSITAAPHANIPCSSSVASTLKTSTAYSVSGSARPSSSLDETNSGPIVSSVSLERHENCSFVMPTCHSGRSVPAKTSLLESEGKVDLSINSRVTKKDVTLNRRLFQSIDTPPPLSAESERKKPSTDTNSTGLSETKLVADEGKETCFVEPSKESEPCSLSQKELQTDLDTPERQPNREGKPSQSEVLEAPCLLKPILTVQESDNGIVLSWDLQNRENESKVEKYELFAMSPSTETTSPNCWDLLGRVDALDLPMACTLNQFLPGASYSFTVRAITADNRCGMFSHPCSVTFNGSLLTVTEKM